jgi:hypothetical protein
VQQSARCRVLTRQVEELFGGLTGLGAIVSSRKRPVDQSIGRDVQQPRLRPQRYRRRKREVIEADAIVWHRVKLFSINLQKFYQLIMNASLWKRRYDQLETSNNQAVGRLNSAGAREMQ